MTLPIRYCNLLLLTVLVACGGGGGGEPAAPAHPLASYVGSFTYCDGHEKLTLAVTELPSGALSLEQRSDYYLNVNCSGAIVGTEVNSSPISAAFISNGAATVTGWPNTTSSATYTVDRVSISVPAFTISLTGTGVSTVNGQRCVAYTGGSTCLNQTSVAAQTIVGGLTLTSTALLMLEATTTGYERVDAYPR